MLTNLFSVLDAFEISLALLLNLPHATELVTKLLFCVAESTKSQLLRNLCKLLNFVTLLVW